MRNQNLLRLFLISLIAANVLAACTNWEDIAIQRDDLVTQLGTEQARMADSKVEVKNRSGDFPASYTQATEPQLAAAQEALANIGSDTEGWLSELNTAIEKKDKKTATDRLERIQTALDQIRAYTNQILGPPEDPSQGLYDTLQAKVDLLHNGYVTGDSRDLLQESKDLDATTLVSVQAAVHFALCGSQTQMSFKDARASYGSGVTYIRSAEQLISTGDEPAASDALVQAIASFNAAIGSITSAPSNHQLAFNAISSANSSKALADLALLNMPADYWYDVSSEHSSGVTDLANAQTACEIEDFNSSITYANSAKSHFESAVYWSTQEEPEETYTPPSNNDSNDWNWSDPIPSNNDSGYDYSNDGGYDYSDDGGYDYSDDGGYDYSDDGGYDYSDDGGY